MMPSPRLLLGGLLAASTLADGGGACNSTAASNNWPQWRGPQRNGHSSENPRCESAEVNRAGRLRERSLRSQRNNWAMALQRTQRKKTMTSRNCVRKFGKFGLRKFAWSQEAARRKSKHSFLISALPAFYVFF